MKQAHKDYYELLRRWSASIRLVGSTKPGDLDQHLADSLAVVRLLPPTTQRVIDVGAGGGFPSVVLAIESPEIEVVALEPIQKKWAFLRTVRRELGLHNFQPLPHRDDDYSASMTDPFDAATSKATFALEEWLTRGQRLVRPGGVVFGFEARPGALPEQAVRHPYARPNGQHCSIVSLQAPTA